MKKEKAIFAFALDCIKPAKVSKLLKRFGYSGTPTPELLMEIMDKEGKAFALPFGKLMQEAAKDPETKAKLLAAAKVSKAAGQNGAATGTSNLTAQQKSDMGLQWFSAIAGLFGTAINSVDDIANATNGTNATLAMAQYTEAQRKAEEAQQKTTLYWILGGVGILLVVVVFVIALSKRS